MEYLRTITKIPEQFLGAIRGTAGSHHKLPEILQLNESVYEFYSPESTYGTSPNVEVVFFHGVHCRNSSKAYLETWTSTNGPTSHCWPKTWLAEEFPRARILSVSYDSSLIKRPRQGRLDLYCTAENLIQDLMDTRGKVASRDGCPLILVGQGLGGLIIKAVCLEAERRGLKTFLNNLKGFLFYSTPHLGLSSLPAEFDSALADTLGWGNKEIARLNDKFRGLRQANNWVAKAILAAYSSSKPQLDVTEASARFDVDDVYTAKEDIDNICKPRKKTSISVTYLIGLISHCLDIGSGISPLTCSTSSFPHPTRTVPASQNKGVQVGTTERGVKILNSSVLFEADEYYVPMERSIYEVRNALSSDSVRIVVLHGGPGFGKSSLARHLALRFQDESNKYCQDVGTAVTSSQDSCFIDGVIYLTCGKGADVTGKLQELLQHLNLNLPLQGVVELRRKLVEHLKDRKALVILDDVWEPDLVENLVVPGQIKYLVTTQVITLWRGGNVRNVSIQDLNLEDARRILGNYAGFPGGIIPIELMVPEVANAIIKATESHPLALATLAVVIGSGSDKTSEDEWREVKDNFLNCLKSDDCHVICFGERYPRTIYAAMTSALEMLDDDARNLLYTIVLFEGPIIRETIVRQFLQCTQPQTSWETMYSTRKLLESLGLVRRTFSLCPCGDVGKQNYRVFVLHGLRQQFILSTMLDFKDASIAKSLFRFNFIHRHRGSNYERDLATALCALYGATIIKKEAIAMLGSHFIWSDSSLWVQLGTLFAWLLCVMLEGKEGELRNQLPTTRAATEVFWMLFNEGQLDDFNMTCLLHATKTTRCACAFLFDLSFMFHGTSHQLCVAAIPFVTQKLLVLSKDGEEAIQLHAIATLRNFSASVTNRIPMVHLPRFLEGLVELLAEDINKSIQQIAIWVLSKLALSDETQVLVDITETKVLMDILETPGLLKSVVMLLFKDMESRCEEAVTLIRSLALAPQNQRTIARFPRCLQRLVGLLARGVDNNIQGESMWALSNLSSSAETQVLMDILATPHILENVVMHLYMDRNGTGICERAARLIGNLASMPQNQCSLAQSYMKSLADLLAPTEDANIQLEALRALGKIASSNETNILMRPLDHGNECLLQYVVNYLCWKHKESKSGVPMLISFASRNQLSKEATMLTREATYLIKWLALAPENQVTIARFPTCLDRLVGLLAPDVDESIQWEAMWALSNLACSDTTDFLIVATPGLLESVVMLFSKDMQNQIRWIATTFIAKIAMAAPQNQPTIQPFPTFLERLVGLLARGEDRTIQERALRALSHLACTDNQVRMDILRSSCVDNNLALINLAGVDAAIPTTSGLLKRVVTFLSKDMQGLCEGALALIRNLALAPANRVTIAEFPCCVEMLGGLLAEDVGNHIQEEAMWALVNLTFGDSDQLRMDILAIPGLLERVMLFLSKDMQGLCEGALALLRNLAVAPANQATIVGFPLCLKMLGGLLAEDVGNSIQEQAIWALANLAYGDNNQLHTDIIASPELLSEVVRLLSPDMESRCKGAARMITHLAVTAAKLTILQFPLCCKRLARLLEADVDSSIQMQAEAALENLGIRYQPS